MDFFERRSSLSPDRLIHLDARKASCAKVAQSSVLPAGTFLPGEDVGGFEVLREIGRSGISILLEGRDRSLERPVMLKVLDPGLSGSTELKARFRIEAALAARVAHPALIPILCRGSRGGHEFYAEPFLGGPTLQGFLENTPEPGGEDFFARLALGLADIARGLDLLHASGVLHRNIKPSNVFVEVTGSSSGTSRWP